MRCWESEDVEETIMIGWGLLGFEDTRVGAWSLRGCF